MLRQISSTSVPEFPLSPFTTPPPPDPNNPTAIQEDLQRERESFNTLADEGGVPSHPVELGFDVLDDPREYKDIISYWQSWPKTDRLLFGAQLGRWRRFREFQQKIRQYHIQRGTFSAYQQKVHERRCRHGLEGQTTPHGDRDEQSKLDNWMEYQDYEYAILEKFEKDIKDTQVRLDAARKVLRDAGISGYEKVFKQGNFGITYALYVKHGNEKNRLEDQRWSAEEKIKLTERRLSAAQSHGFGETIGRAAWIGLFQKELQSAHMRSDKVPKSEDRDNDYMAGGKYCYPDPDGEEDFGVAKRKWWDAEMKRRDADAKRHTAEANAWWVVKRAEEGLKAAQSDDFGGTVERAALVRSIEEELGSAQTRFDESIQLREKLKLKGKELDALYTLGKTKGELERHKILLEWTERQRRVLASKYTNSNQDTKSHGDQGQVRKSRTRSLRNRAPRKVPGPNRCSKGSTHKGKRSTALSILSPVDPSKVSKVAQKQSIPTCRKKGLARDILQSTEKEITNPQLSIKRTSTSREIMPTFLRPIHSSRLSKTRRLSGGTQSREPHASFTNSPADKRRNNGKRFATSFTPSAGRKPVEQSTSAKALLRRSPRTRMKPERFWPS